MRQSSTLLISLLAAIVLLSCRPSAKKMLNRADGIVLLPENLEVYHSNLTLSNFNGATSKFPLKIFTVINVSCATCILKFTEWEQFRNEAARCATVLIAPICLSSDKFEMIKYLFENDRVGEVNFPLLLDSTETFGALNKRFGDVMSGISVLTNSHNEVLLTGNPIEDKADRKKFLDIICNYNQ